MRGTTGGMDERGVSEIYGTVLIISLAFIIAILLIAVGTFVVSEMQSESEDSLTQDSMVVMNERIADVTGSDVDSASEIAFPDAEGDLEASAGNAEVNVTVTAANLDARYLEADSASNSTEISLGTIAMESDETAHTAWQGGALFEREQGVTSIREPPQLDYDGTRLSLGFTSLTETPRLRAGQEYTVRGDSESSVQTTEEIYEAISKLWTVKPDENDDALGTDHVHVTLEIESEFADGWATWAEEGMQQPADYVDTGDDQVEIQFHDVGSALDEELFSEPDDWTDGVLFAGTPTLAVLNEAIEPVEDGGFVINDTYGEPGQDWFLAIWDKTETEFVFTRGGSDNDWWVQDGDGEFGPIQSVEGPNADERVERLRAQIGGDAITDSDAELDGDEGDYVYSFSNPEALCLVGEQGPRQLPDYEELRAEDACGDLLGMSNDPRTITSGPEFTVNDVQLDDSQLEEGEPLAVTATINNTGDVPGDGSVLLKVEDGRTTGISVDGITVTGRVVDETSPSEHSSEDELGIGEQQVVEFEWTPERSDLAHLYGNPDENIGLGGENTTMKVVTGSDVGESEEVEYEYDPPGQARFTIADTESTAVDLTVRDTFEEDDVARFVGGSMTFPHDDAEDWDGLEPDNQEVEVEVPVFNDGDEEGTQTVALWYENDDRNVPVALEEATLGPGENEDVELSWDMESIDEDVDELVFNVTTHDDSQRAATIQN